jgi:hypothetical protein
MEMAAVNSTTAGPVRVVSSQEESAVSVRPGLTREGKVPLAEMPDQGFAGFVRHVQSHCQCHRRRGLHAKFIQPGPTRIQLIPADHGISGGTKAVSWVQSSLFSEANLRPPRKIFTHPFFHQLTVAGPVTRVSTQPVPIWAGPYRASTPSWVTSVTAENQVSPPVSRLCSGASKASPCRPPVGRSGTAHPIAMTNHPIPEIPRAGPGHVFLSSTGPKP